MGMTRAGNIPVYSLMSLFSDWFRTTIYWTWWWS